MSSHICFFLVSPLCKDMSHRIQVLRAVRRKWSRELRSIYRQNWGLSPLVYLPAGTDVPSES
ncbi:hypothetical protein D9619_006617 [Psilocybe cf. subviscida]|uniref:Uncharacterized protein n=1 Tax=Psilocybe cf. subviscida TaxID=2480587 RepID=A0A8H5B4Y9_9AGAR|nr:hypothetical protein D9619_006617 [Psilocybe cf. subviscida]